MYPRSLSTALYFAAGARRPGSRRSLLLQGGYQGRQWLLTPKRMPSTEAGELLQERQRASEKQKKRMHDSRGRALKDMHERGHFKKSSVLPRGASSATDSEDDGQGSAVQEFWQTFQPDVLTGCSGPLLDGADTRKTPSGDHTSPMT